MYKAALLAVIKVLLPTGVPRSKEVGVSLMGISSQSH